MKVIYIFYYTIIFLICKIKKSHPKKRTKYKNDCILATFPVAFFITFFLKRKENIAKRPYLREK